LLTWPSAETIRLLGEREFVEWEDLEAHFGCNRAGTEEPIRVDGGSGGAVNIDYDDESGEEEPVEYMEDRAEEGNEYDDDDLSVNDFPN
jgi:hypothetical protein